MEEWKDVRSSSPAKLQNCNSQLNNHWQENVGSHQKKIPPSLQEDGRRGEIAFRIKLHTHQRCSEGSNKTLCTPGPRDPTETEPDLTLSVWMSPAEVQVTCCRAGTLGAADLGLKQPVAWALLEEVTIYPIIEPLSRWPKNCRTAISNKLLHC